MNPNGKGMADNIVADTTKLQASLQFTYTSNFKDYFHANRADLFREFSVFPRTQNLHKDVLACGGQNWGGKLQG